MKIRRGFVANSSSSTYICDVCGDVESGMDLGLEELSMYQCSNGHYFHNHEAMYNVDDDPTQLQLDAKIELTGDEDDADLVDVLDELRYSMPPNTCPICMLKVVEDSAVLRFAVIELRTNLPNLQDRFRQRFKTYHEYIVWRKENYDKYTGHLIGPVSD